MAAWLSPCCQSVLKRAAFGPAHDQYRMQVLPGHIQKSAKAYQAGDGFCSSSRGVMKCRDDFVWCIAVAESVSAVRKYTTITVIWLMAGKHWPCLLAYEMAYHAIDGISEPIISCQGHQ